MFNKKQWIILLVTILIATSLKTIFPTYSVLDLILMLTVSFLSSYFLYKNYKEKETKQ